MLEHKDVLSFIDQTGYKTMSEIIEHFSSENEEVLVMTLEFIVKKNLAKKIKMQTPKGPEQLFFKPET